VTALQAFETCHKESPQESVDLSVWHEWFGFISVLLWCPVQAPERKTS